MHPFLETRNKAKTCFFNYFGKGKQEMKTENVPSNQTNSYMIGTKN